MYVICVECGADISGGRIDCYCEVEVEYEGEDEDE